MKVVRKTEGRRRLKREAVAYKGGRCILCGYDRCLAALSFHHRDRNVKKFHLSQSQMTDLASVKEELDKCDLLCMNCHMEVEYGDVA